MPPFRQTEGLIDPLGTGRQRASVRDLPRSCRLRPISWARVALLLIHPGGLMGCTTRKAGIMQRQNGHPLTVFGDGSQTRAFCYVDDLIDGLVRLMDTAGDGLREPVNLGNPIEMSILSLAELSLR
jgi:nucleoside-diphosphate-sugar epimerase